MTSRYIIEKIKLISSGNTSLYEVVLEGDSNKYMYKTYDGNVINEERKKLINEYNILKHLQNEDAIIHVEKYIDEPHDQGILMEYFEGLTLQKFIDKRKVTIDEIMIISKNIANGMYAYQQDRVLHLDISADNIMINEESLEIKIIDFGSAVIVPKGHHGIKHVVNEGSPVYMAPEMTGRMNRDIDYRSDFYSLGVIFYQLFTGEVPFSSDDLLEIVYMHITKSVEKHKSFYELPYQLFALIKKLMAKGKEERYQSIKGLLYDLDMIHNMINENLVNIEFELGGKDVYPYFNMSEKIYGRDKELELLQQGLERMGNGSSEINFISGPAGSGKTSLISEMRRSYEMYNSYYVYVKLDQFKKDLSYNLVNEILGKLVASIVIESESRREYWKEKILTTLGENAWIIMNVVPELEKIIGKMKKVQDLGYNESKNRYNNTVSKFYGLFPREDHPLVIVVDDIQWADQASISFISSILAVSQTAYLSMILLYRDNEVIGNPHVQDLFTSAKKHGNDYYIQLEALKTVDIEDFFGDITGQAGQEINEIARILKKKTDGNPFFIREVLRKMEKNQWINFDLKDQRWVFDMENIQKEEVTNNVADFLLELFSVLPDTCKDILKIAACLGNIFSLKDLILTSHFEEDKVLKHLQEAINEEIILPLMNNKYAFGHDRLQKAAIELASKDEVIRIHLEIALMLQKRYDENPGYELRIILADHYKKALPIIEEDSIISTMIGLNYDISSYAKESAGFESAYLHITFAEELYKKLKDTVDLELKCKIQFERAISACLISDYTLSESLFKDLLEQTKLLEDKVEIHIQRAILYSILSDQEKAMQATMDGLELLGVNIPFKPSKGDLLKEYIRTQIVLRNIDIKDLVQYKEIDNKQIKLAIRLMVGMVPNAYIGGHKELFAWMALKLTQLSVKYGHFEQSAYIYAMYGVFLCVGFKKYNLGREFGDLSIALKDKYNDLNTECRIYHGYGSFILPWTAHFDETTKWLEEGLRSGTLSGDYLYMSHIALSIHLWDQSLSFSELLEVKSKHLEMIRRANYKDLTDGLEILIGMYMNFLGRTEDKLSISYGDFDQDLCLREMKERNFIAGITVYHMRRAEVLLAHYAFEEAKEQMKLSDENRHGVMGLPYTIRIAFLNFITEAYTMKRKSIMSKEYRYIKKVAKSNPNNFKHLLLIMDAIYSFDKKRIKAIINKFKIAIECANQNKWPREEALANELIGKYFFDQAYEQLAAGYIVRAISLYKNCGAIGKVNQLNEYFRELNTLSTIIEPTEEDKKTSMSTTKASIPDKIDMESLLKSSHSITSEMNLDVLQKKILEISVENAGAEKGILFVLGDSGFKATAKVDKDGSKILDNLLLENLEDVSRPLVQKVINGESYICFEDASNRLDLQSDRYIQDMDVKSLLIMGLYRNNDLRGIVYLENNLLIGVFNEKKIELLQVLSSEMIISIENAMLYHALESHNLTLEKEVEKRTQELTLVNRDMRIKNDDLQKAQFELEKMANTDPLTSLFNRRRILERLEHENARFKRTQLGFAIMILDIDDFKSVNDTYGHDCGDYVLCEISNHIKSAMREQDSLARWGGEEFLVLLPGTDLNGARIAAEKIRHEIETMKLNYKDIVLTITATIGLSIYNDGKLKLDDVIILADKALYEGKQSGKNCIKYKI